MKLISVIVPIYNVEPFLHRCVDSIIHQSCSNLEIILVDDGSPDNCPAICDSYAELDSRIKVVHKRNGGLSDARNAGLAVATGELIAFVDSDDWVAENYIETMYQAIKQQNADIVECGFIRTDGASEVALSNGDGEVESYGTVAAMELLIRDSVFHQIVWNKLYKRDVIGTTGFAVGKYNEDEFWTYQVFGKANRVTKIQRVLYYYFQNNNSIMGQGYKLKRLDAIEAKCERQIYIEKRFPKLKDIAATDLIGSIIYAGQMSLLHLQGEERAQALSILQASIKRFFGNARYRLVGKQKHTVWYYIAIHNLVFACTLRNLLRMNV